MSHPQQSYFVHRDAAARYEQYRPKVHQIAVEWLRAHGWGRFQRALDIACGTGDSMLPLLNLASQVEGIDLSDAMLDHARSKGLSVRRASYEEVAPGIYDLLSVRMAFHWFDAPTAVQAFKRASSERAVWLIYNFWLGGAPGNAMLDEWLRSGYLQRFPSPRRSSTRFALPEGDRSLRIAGEGRGALTLQLHRDQLVGYLTTQSNVEAAIAAGISYAQAEQLLDAEMPPFSLVEDMSYAYDYAIVEFRRAAAE
ncbi:MAG: class I SAM-dependent methyltransferase [Pseudomonadota bacterium]